MDITLLLILLLILAHKANPTRFGQAYARVRDDITELVREKQNLAVAQIKKPLFTNSEELLAFVKSAKALGVQAVKVDDIEVSINPLHLMPEIQEPSKNNKGNAGHANTTKSADDDDVLFYSAG